MAEQDSTGLPLAGCRVMVTRPQNQAVNLCQLLQDAGAECYQFPALVINDVSDPTVPAATLQRIADYDIIIFISPNAVEYGARYLTAAGGLPAQILIAAVGAGTARTIQYAFARPADIVPQTVFNSEALLAEPALAQVKDKRVLIVRGVGGREALAECLRDRGAQVDYVEVYQRVQPEVDRGRLTKDWQQQPMAYIIASSGEGLQNLPILAGEDLQPTLFATTLLVVNERLQSLAKAVGFSDIIVSEQVSDDALVQTLISHHLS